MNRLDPALPPALFITALALYLRTLAPSLLYGDSAEFQTIAYTLGLGHPTGYPVYVLFAKLFTFLPIGEIAWRVNFFSAFCAALTVTIIFLIDCQLGAASIPALFGALTLAVAPLFWKQAAIAEVYAPGAAFLALVFYAVLRWRETKASRWLFLAGLLGGLSLGIHATVALSGLAILLYLALSTRQRANWLHAILGALTGSILSLAAFILLDTLDAPAGYFNTVVRPSLSVWSLTPADFDSTFEHLSFLLFPPQFKGQFFNVPSVEIIARLKDFAAQASWYLDLAFLGFVALLIPRKETPSRWREAVLLMLAFATFLTFAVTYNVYDFYVFYIPALLVLAVSIGLGANAIVKAFALIPKLPRFVPTVLAVLILVAGLYLFRNVVVSSWKERIPPGLEDWEVPYFTSPAEVRGEVEQLAEKLEDNAIVFTDWDHAYRLYYVTHVIQGRTRLDFHETFPQEGVSQLAESALGYIEANLSAGRPIYFSERPSQLAARFKITRAGSSLFRIEKK